MNARLTGLSALMLAAAFLVLAAAPALAAPGDPIFILRPQRVPNSPVQIPPPAGEFSGPCGLAVDAQANFYVSDYYHHAIDLYSPGAGYTTQLAKEDPLDGPCALALDPAGNLYVNNYHRNVVRFGSLTGFGTGTVIAGAGVDATHPTGVAVDAAGTVYVDERDRIASFDAVGVEGPPVGVGSLQDGYGVAVSGYPATGGFLYVPDAATNTVKVYDPATSTTDPVAEIAGSATPPGRFVSLRDSAVAVDNARGTVYVADDLTPEYTEGHEGVVYAFDASGAYLGRLRHPVQTALPAGLAVDNSPTATQGRVYVTDGYSEGAAVYAYAPESALSATSATAATAAASLSDLPATAPPAPPAPGASTSPEAAARPSGAEILQHANVRVRVSGELTPKKLPRSGRAPIAVSVGGQIETTDGSPAPQLQTLGIELNREGKIDTKGLPLCPYDALEPASSARAMASCRSALVGKGSFEAEVSLTGEESYIAKGKLLAFNGRKGAKPVLFAHIYSPQPFATSFVITFEIKHASGGQFGSALVAQLPKTLSSWGKLTGIELRLDRRYTSGGERRSYLSAGCPAPKGFAKVAFPLARTSFGFAGGPTLRGTLTRTCKAVA
jgi:hypothetical protein